MILLNKADIITSIITARVNGTVRERAKMLNIRELFEGQKNKLEASCITDILYHIGTKKSILFLEISINFSQNMIKCM